MSNSTDKLARLANFGSSAGSKPAAAAVSKLPSSTQSVSSEASGSRKEGSSIPATTKTEKSDPLDSADLDRTPLIRNVAFTPEDRMHLDRIAELLRKAGEFRPSISDLVRVALRGSSSLDASSTLRMLEESRKYDGRRKPLK